LRRNDHDAGVIAHCPVLTRILFCDEPKQSVHLNATICGPKPTVQENKLGLGGRLIECIADLTEQILCFRHRVEYGQGHPARDVLVENPRLLGSASDGRFVLSDRNPLLGSKAMANTLFGFLAEVATCSANHIQPKRPARIELMAPVIFAVSGSEK
jgi:hypothetical protein